MPEAGDDDDHDQPIPTTSIGGATTSLENPEPTKPPGNPSGHHERPTKPAKPAKPAVTTESSIASSGEPEAQEATETPSSHWVSWLPTFGASKKAQVWIYGAVGLILAFCMGLSIWLFIIRRRKMRNDPRNTYEFELLDDEETRGLNTGEKAVGGRKARRTRGGELYDAFAEGSEDEDDVAYSDGIGGSREQLHGDAAGDQYVIGEESSDDEDEKGQGRTGGGRS